MKYNLPETQSLCKHGMNVALLKVQEDPESFQHRGIQRLTQCLQGSVQPRRTAFFCADSIYRQLLGWGGGGAQAWQQAPLFCIL